MGDAVWILKVSETDDYTYSFDVTIGVFNDEIELIEAEQKYKKENPNKYVFYEEVKLNTILR